MPVLSSPEERAAARVPQDADGQRSGLTPPTWPRPIGRVDAWLRRAVMRRLAGVTDGRLSIIEPDGLARWGDPRDGAMDVAVRVLDPRFFRLLALGGNLGAAEGYVRAYWDCDDLVGLVRLMCRHAGLAEGVDRGLARLAAPLKRLAHWLRRNTVRGSRRNIAAHYDLSNDFFAAFLDETMTYSCGIFERPDATMREASEAKYDRICRKLRLGPGDHVGEIGTGWGGFAMHAAVRYGCRVTTTTISRRQYDLARQRVEEAGLSPQVTVLREDYRRLAGRFDKLVSIEMIEAVGHAYLDTFFRKCAELLKPDGAMLLQAITIADQRYARYRRGVDFIQQYVFPGGHLPSVTAMMASLTRATDLRLAHLEDITPHYAETLSRWRRRFHANLDRIRGLGLPDELLRIWEFYFCYCEGGFRERWIGDVQMLLARPGWRDKPILGAIA